MSTEQPAIYSIRVRGFLDVDWSDRLAGMQITVQGGAVAPCSQLVGRLSDQAALMGVLNALYNLGLPIVRVESLAEASPLSESSGARTKSRRESGQRSGR